MFISYAVAEEIIAFYFTEIKGRRKAVKLREILFWHLTEMYKRVILKLSGEALSGDKKGTPYDNEVISKIIVQIKPLIEKGVEIGIVVGGGNLWRGRDSNPNMDRTKSDQIGMLATVMNGVYLADSLKQAGINAVVHTPIKIGTISEEFSKDSALLHMESKTVVIFAGGIGHPFFSTDTVTALRGAELEADILLFAKSIDGVYDDDPKKNPNAKKLDEIKCFDIVKNNLQIIDIAAANLCFEQKIPVLLFALNEENSIIRAFNGENIGTIITV